MAGWVRLIRSRGIRYLYGYPSSLHMFGQYILKHDFDLSMTAVFSTAEKYFDFEREVLIASGMTDDSRVADYLRKQDELHRQITLQ